MKKFVPFAIVIAVLFAACKKEDTQPEESGLKNGVFIVNQGNFTAGNASLSYFESATSKLTNDLFYEVNDAPLGDVAQSISIVGDLAYIVINNSGNIYVIDRKTAEFKGKISQLTSPRFFLKINDQKAYVSDLASNSISIVNPESYELTDAINVNRSTENMVLIGNKAYVAHWSGYLQAIKNNQVLIIDTETDALIDSIQVGVEPNSMVVDRDQNLWVLCSGGYDNEEIPSLWKINVLDKNVIKKFEFDDISLSPFNLLMNGTGDELLYLNNGVYSMSVTDGTLPENPMISQDGKYFYALGIDPQNSDIYVSDALDYNKNGLVYRYDYTGSMLDSFEVGIIPGAFGFNY
ncbi:MAG: cell surface protein [Marinilabiliales bacterium]|nr:MAG: cell surface protein [Marinilabiliales bacterium]